MKRWIALTCLLLGATTALLGALLERQSADLLAHGREGRTTIRSKQILTSQRGKIYRICLSLPESNTELHWDLEKESWDQKKVGDRVDIRYPPDRPENFVVGPSGQAEIQRKRGHQALLAGLLLAGLGILLGLVRRPGL